MEVDRKQYIHYTKWNDIFFVRVFGMLLFDCRKNSSTFAESIGIHEYYKIPLTKWRVRFLGHEKRL